LLEAIEQLARVKGGQIKMLARLHEVIQVVLNSEALQFASLVAFYDGKTFVTTYAIVKTRR